MRAKLTDVQKEFLAKAVPTMQIILVALASGVTMFMGIVLFMRNANPAPVPAPGPVPDPVLSYLALGLAAVAFLGWMIVPRVVASLARRAIVNDKDSSMVAKLAAHPVSPIPPEVGVVGQLGRHYLTKLIFSNAMLEGAALFNLIAAMVEGSNLGIVAAVVLILLILTQFPTRGRQEDWVVQQLETIDQMRTRSEKFGRFE